MRRWQDARRRVRRRLGVAPGIAGALLAASVPGAAEPPGHQSVLHTGPGLSLHRDMYALPVTYAEHYRGPQTETIFRLSAKHRFFGTRLYFAYTQISFWQSYDYRNSSPFRETNYNPEIFYRFVPRPFAGGTVGLDAGYEHESNGRLAPFSRSWNVFVATPSYSRSRFLVAVKLRWRIPEDEKEFPGDALGDDNPDILDYLGYADVHLHLDLGGGQRAHLTGWGNPSTERGGLDFLYSVPVPRADDSYLVAHLSHGYGESLIDYDRSITRVGVGVAFSR